jgi:hypothetical protein
MKNKSLSRILVFSFFILFLSSPPSHSAIKSGDACKKLGITATASGKKYVCVKSGKKLVWNKGVVVSTPNSDPSSSLNFAKRWNATGSSAIKIMEKAFPAKPSAFPKVELTWRYSDTVNNKIKEEITKQYLENIEFWSAYTKIDAPLQVIVGTLDDIKFICKWRDSHLQMNAANCESNFRTDKQRVWDAHTTQGNGKATDFYFMTEPSILTEIDFLPRVAHEFFHNVQNAQTDKYKSSFPCWVEEGGAEYFGILVTSKGNPETFIKMRQFAVALKSNKTNLFSSKDYWRDYLLSADVTSVKPNSDSWGCAAFQNTGLYGNILLATEYLHQQLGIAGVLALYGDTGTIGWDKAIEKAFKKSKAEIYDDIASYMLTEFQIAAKQDWARPNCSMQGRVLQCASGP